MVFFATVVNRAHKRPPPVDVEGVANRFAATLLMPNNMVADLRAAGFDRRGMAEKLGVSEHAMAIRLGEPYP